MTIGVLFVCTANICRSPTAEGVFRTMAREAGLEAALEIASAGTSDIHTGDPPARAASEAAAARGYDMSDIRARKVTTEDIVRFDYVLAMDRGHLADLRWLAPRALTGKPQLFMSFAPPFGLLDVSDPYGGRREDYERALDLIEAGCRGLLDHLAVEVKKAI
jgi:protein-tyrosine phosphatase